MEGSLRYSRLELLRVARLKICMQPPPKETPSDCRRRPASQTGGYPLFAALVRPSRPRNIPGNGRPATEVSRAGAEGGSRARGSMGGIDNKSRGGGGNDPWDEVGDTQFQFGAKQLSLSSSSSSSSAAGRSGIPEATKPAVRMSLEEERKAWLASQKAGPSAVAAPKQTQATEKKAFFDDFNPNESEADREKRRWKADIEAKAARRGPAGDGGGGDAGGGSSWGGGSLFGGHSAFSAFGSGAFGGAASGLAQAGGGNGGAGSREGGGGGWGGADTAQNPSQSPAAASASAAAWGKPDSAASKQAWGSLGKASTSASTSSSASAPPRCWCWRR